MKVLTVDQASALTEGPRIEMLPLGGVMPDHRNPKDHDVGLIITSIEEQGFWGALIRDERTGQLIAGHGRLKALKAMRDRNYATPSGIESREDDWYVPVILGWSSTSNAHAAKAVIADNRISEVGGWNQAELSSLLVEIDTEGLLENIGYDADDLENIIEQLDKSIIEYEKCDSCGSRLKVK